MATIGYARVSTTDQNLELQLDALKNAGALRTFSDQGVSGPKTEYPQLKAALDHPREGTSSRCGSLTGSAATPATSSRSSKTGKPRGVGFKSLTEYIDSTGTGGAPARH